MVDTLPGQDPDPLYAAAQHPLAVLSSVGLDELCDSSLNAFLGISLSKTRYFCRNTMRHYMAWACGCYGDLIVIVADHLEIYNQQVFKSRSYDDAVSYTQKTGRELQLNYRRAIPDGLQDRIEVVTASELLRQPGCARFLAAVEEAVAAQPDFARAIQATLMDAVGSRFEEQGYNRSEAETRLKMLERYLLEEIAIILHLTEHPDKPYEVSIFPYPPPPIFPDIYAGRYPIAGFDRHDGVFKAIELVDEARRSMIG